MLNTVWAVVREGRIELLEQVALPEGTKLLVTFAPSEDDRQFWAAVSQSSLENIWGNEQDDVYAQLLEE